jgi:hypothetical protein
VGRISHKDIQFHPHKTLEVQELSDRDMTNRSTAAERLIKILPDDVIVLMADEAQFHLSGSVNKHDFRYWA